MNPEDNENYKGAFDYECDLCAVGPEKDESVKRVKWKFGGIVCKPCYFEVNAIRRGNKQ